MAKRLWINIALLGFIILLSVLLFNNKEETDQELPRLSDINQNDIVQIKVLRKNLGNFEFNKQNEAWYLSSPQQFRVNSARINAMLRILNVESHGQLNPDETEAGQLGLSEPLVIMKLNDHEFKFGNTDAIDQRRYVLFDGKIHLTNDSLYQQLMTNAAFFADPKLLPEHTKVTSIQFPDNKIESVNGQWQLQTLMDISPDQLKRIAFNWENSIAISAEQYQPSESTLESNIKITTKNNTSIQFLVVSSAPHLILARKDLGIQFHMGSDETKKLLLLESIDTNEETAPIGLELN